MPRKRNCPSPLDPLLVPSARLRVIPADRAAGRRISPSQRFRVSPRSDRMGYRLEGATIDAAPGELISTAVPTGAIQVPPTGQPILLMNDHATTGGYAIAGTRHHGRSSARRSARAGRLDRIRGVLDRRPRTQSCASGRPRLAALAPRFHQGMVARVRAGARSAPR